MPAQYPTSGPWTRTPKVDGSDPVIASDVNEVYLEVTAIETVVGLNPSKPNWSSATLDTSTVDFGTVSARIANVEGAVNVAFNQRVNTSGGSTIAPSSTTVGLTFQTSGTGNLINFKNTSGTTITSVTKDGWINVIDGGSA